MKKIKIEFNDRYLFFFKMYYHGTLKSSKTPNFPEDKFTFMVLHQQHIKPKNKWETYGPKDSYCNNCNIIRYSNSNDSYLEQCEKYICLGHKSIDDMKFAQEEWKKYGWDTDVKETNITTEKLKIEKEDKETINLIENCKKLSNKITQNTNIQLNYVYERKFELATIMDQNFNLQYINGFLYNKIQELETENAKLRAEFKEILTALTIKKPIDEEITELQARIMQLYNEKDKN